MFTLLSCFLGLATVTHGSVPHLSQFATAAEPHQFPWMVGIMYQNRPYCGAALVKVGDDAQESDIVITAAHCLTLLDEVPDPKIGTLRRVPNSEYKQTKDFKLLFGNHLYSKDEPGEQIRGIKNMEYVPPWDKHYNTRGMQHDLALIQLDSPVRFSATIQPIALPHKGDQLDPGTGCVTTGWGSEVAFRANKLHYMNVAIQNDSVCAEAWDSHDPLTKYNESVMYCVDTGRGLPVVCGGDSGGPLFCQHLNEWVQFGIISFGSFPCYEYDAPAGYTRIERYIDWITKKIDQWHMKGIVKSDES